MIYSDPMSQSWPKTALEKVHSNPGSVERVCLHIDMQHLFYLQQGVDIDAVDNIGWSAIFHAASAGHQTTTELLIECGANCDIT